MTPTSITGRTVAVAIVCFTLTAHACKREPAEDEEDPSPRTGLNVGENAPSAHANMPSMVPGAPAQTQTPEPPPMINDGPAVQPGDEGWIELARQLGPRLLAGAPTEALVRLRPYVQAGPSESTLFVRFVAPRGNRYVGVHVSLPRNGKVRYEEISVSPGVAWYSPGPPLSAADLLLVAPLATAAARARAAISDPACALPWLDEHELTHRYAAHSSQMAGEPCTRARTALRGLQLGSSLTMTTYYGTARFRVASVAGDFTFRAGQWVVSNVH
jgi:hypothetical protein